jgi:hypothetical protein
MPKLSDAAEAQKTWCGKYLIRYKINLDYLDNRAIKHGSRIILDYTFAKEVPCFPEFQNRQRMEGAMNI